MGSFVKQLLSKLVSEFQNTYTFIMTEEVETPTAPATEEVKAKPAPKSVKAKAEKAKKPASKSTHPTTAVMVKAAIKNLKDKSGSSFVAIKKYIATNYKVDVVKLAPHIRKALKSGVEKKTLLRTKGTGANGSFKLAKVEKAEKPKAAKKKATPKKAEKKVTPKKALKKVTKSPKAKKPVAKKSTPKKAAPKPKKATPKKAAPKSPPPKKAAK